MLNEKPKFELPVNFEIKVPTEQKGEKPVVVDEEGGNKLKEQQIKQLENKIDDLSKIKGLRVILGVSGINTAETERVEGELGTKQENLEDLKNGRKIIFPEMSNNIESTEDEVALTTNEAAIEVNRKVEEKNTQGFGNIGGVWNREQFNKELENAQIRIDAWDSKVNDFDNAIIIAEENLKLTDEEIKAKFGDLLNRTSINEMIERNNGQKKKRKKYAID